MSDTLKLFLVHVKLKAQAKSWQDRGERQRSDALAAAQYFLSVSVSHATDLIDREQCHIQLGNTRANCS
jgi:hypothetical protein